MFTLSDQLRQKHYGKLTTAKPIKSKRKRITLLKKKKRTVI